MKNFNRGGSKFGGGRDFKGSKFGRQNDRERFSMHHAVCSDCGNDCQVPFLPTGGKPVYCNNCFQNHRTDNNRTFERRDEGRQHNSYPERKFEQRNVGSDDHLKKQIESLNWKLDKILKILTPTVIPAAVQPQTVQTEKAITEEPTVKPKKKKVSVKK